jgi:STE24 endopeptidase
MLVVVTATPAGRALAGWADGFGRGLAPGPRGVVAFVVFVTALVALWELAVLPALFYQATAVDARYRTGRPRSGDVVVAHAGALVVALPLVFGAAVIVRLSFLAGAAWWVAASAALAAATVGVLSAGPALFARWVGARPLSRPALSARLTRLGREAGVDIAGLYELPVGETSRTVALVTGLGRARRVFVASPVVAAWSHDEIAVVVAHELAHHAHRDLPRTLALDAAVLATALGASDAVVRAVGPRIGVADATSLAALPALALVGGLVWLAATPIRHAWSRRLERRADAFALRLTGQADAFAAVIRRLGEAHLLDDRPSGWTRWFYHRHPPTAERLAMAAAFDRGDATG